jgi:hypothetical protein
MAKRYYTVAEANQWVPELRELFGRVMQLRAQVKLVYQRLAEAGHAPSDEEIESDDDDELEGDVELEVDQADEFGGQGDDAGEQLSPEVVRDKAWFSGLLETLRDQIVAIQDTGCLIKDIEIGLVDWVSVHQGREVYLCWRYGESQVAWWHEIEAGFAGRRPISELEPGGD